MKQLTGLLLIWIYVTAGLHAQSYSYVYIQGDKSTPFYVKLEGEMLPRYGKHYCIIPRLETGIINIDILFQQNLYPPQQFTIKVPENGCRSFLLTKKGEQFNLFDLRQGFYLPAGNGGDEDRMPDPDGAAQPEKNITSVPEIPPAKAGISGTGIPGKVTADPRTPQFIEDIELVNDLSQVRDQAGSGKNESYAEKEQEHTEVITTGGLPGSDGCAQPFPAGQYEALYRRTLRLESEEARLGYLNNQAGNCYSTDQAGRLVQTLKSDAARYSWLKKVYPRITDPAAFGSLAELFSNEGWKAYFMELIQ